jgi:hypothetical protein
MLHFFWLLIRAFFFFILFVSLIDLEEFRAQSTSFPILTVCSSFFIIIIIIISHPPQAESHQRTAIPEAPRETSGAPS